MVFGAFVDIAIISLGLSIVSQVLQNKFAHKDEMKTHQEKMKAHQEKMKELMKKNDAKSQQEIEKIQGELMGEMNKMMSKSTKVMMFSLVVFLPAYWGLSSFYATDVIQLPLPIPWFVEGFDLLNIGTWGIRLYNETNWLGWYLLTYLVIGIIISQAMKLTKIGTKREVVVNG